jgi:hypothetical protein
MAGLVPAIHTAPLRKTFHVSDRITAWMAGTSPAMTRVGCLMLGATVELSATGIGKMI